MAKPRVLVIGIDSGTWDVFDPAIERGCMPNLQKLRDGGCHGVLRSTTPPLTPPAWTTLMTGVHPAKHGILGFQKYDVKTNDLTMNTMRDIAVETMWSYLSRLGRKVASINMPMTYPPLAVNGVMISGFGNPGKDSNFTWPEDLKDQIAERIPGYDNSVGWEGGTDLADDNAFEQAIRVSTECFANEDKLFKLIDEQCPWELLLIQIHQMDRYLHFGWGTLQPEYWEEHPERAQKVFGMLGRLDEFIGTMMATMDPAKDFVGVVSDHGHGPAFGRIKPNILLRQWGYLHTKRWVDYMWFRMTKNVRNLRRRKDQGGMRDQRIDQEIKLDLRRSRAFVVQADQLSSLFVNLKGRQPGGIVSPGAEYEEIVGTLKQRFEEVCDPDTGQKVFARVERPQELYGMADEEAAAFGDLMLVPQPTYWLRGRLHGDTPIDHIQGDLKGTHSYNAMYLLYGPTVRAGLRLDADIADIVPTLYALLGVPIPGKLDGEVLLPAFAAPPTIVMGDSIVDTKGGGVVEFSSEEEENIKKSLEALGYI